MNRLITTSLFVGLAACATIGDESAFPDPVENGAGPFRNFKPAELGREEGDGDIFVNDFTPPEAGRLMRSGNSYFYTTAALIADAPDPDENLAPFDVDWTRHEPRRIFESSVGDNFAIVEGSVVFAPEEPWQASGVFDPWVIATPGDPLGDERLYFAAGNTIGVAFRSGDGTFGNSRQLIDDGVSPSVIEWEGEYWMFFERNDELVLATSMDGLDFEIQQVGLYGGPDRIASGLAEVAQRSPAAAVITSALGRPAIAIYFLSVIDNGEKLSSLVNALGTRDGETFFRNSAPMTAQDNPNHPAPFVADDFTTLYSSCPSRRRHEWCGGVSPIESLPRP